MAAAAAAVAVWWGQRGIDSTVGAGGRPAAPVVEERPTLPITAPAGGFEAVGSAGSDVIMVRADAPARARAGAFVPLGWDGSLRPIEIGRVTRVRMPTSLAARFGWPLLPDGPDARVAADVLLGEDGTARAVRFLPATYQPGPARPGSTP